jgi:hypothetical protein
MDKDNDQIIKKLEEDPKLGRPNEHELNNKN